MEEEKAQAIKNYMNEWVRIYKDPQSVAKLTSFFVSRNKTDWLLSGNANCCRINLTGEDLSHANLSHAYFIEGNFSGCNVFKVNFDGTHLDMARFTNTQQLRSKQLANANFDVLIDDNGKGNKARKYRRESSLLVVYNTISNAQNSDPTSCVNQINNPQQLEILENLLMGRDIKGININITMVGSALGINGGTATVNNMNMK